MGSVRSLLRKYFHTYNLLPDFTAESFTPTLSYAAWWVTAITLVFYIIVSFAIVVTLRVSEAKAHAPEAKPVPAGAHIADSWAGTGSYRNLLHWRLRKALESGVTRHSRPGECCRPYRWQSQTG